MAFTDMYQFSQQQQWQPSLLYSFPYSSTCVVKPTPSYQSSLSSVLPYYGSETLPIPDSASQFPIMSSTSSPLASSSSSSLSSPASISSGLSDISSYLPSSSLYHHLRFSFNPDCNSNSPRRFICCDECNHHFKEHPKLIWHQMLPYNDKQVCEICQGPFFCPIPIITCSRKNRGFFCKLCEKSFDRADRLLAHSRVHTGIKMYTCTLCAKSFSRKDRLTAHNRKSHNALSTKYNRRSSGSSSSSSGVDSTANTSSITTSNTAGDDNTNSLS